MSEPGIIYIERADCGDCYRCVRECPVKAVRMTGAAAEIDAEKCVVCGACLGKCNWRSVKMRDDLYLCRTLMANDGIKIASVSPEWMVEFEGISAKKFVGALLKLGFTHVSESALGAKATLAEEARLMVECGSMGISTRCPAATDYIRKYKPRLAPMLLDVVHPAVAHARMCREWWGTDVKVIHISSCAAGKSLADKYSEDIDVAITFNELKRWLRNDGLLPEKIKADASCGFEPFEADSAIGYTLAGWGAQREYHDMFEKYGIIAMPVTSLEAMSGVLHLLPAGTDEPVYLDFTACPGGCIGSKTVTVPKSSSVDLRILFERAARSRKASNQQHSLPEIYLKPLADETAPHNAFVSESDTTRTLMSLGMSSETDRINCNACGFITCRRFAKALSRGDVRREMCPVFMKTELRNRFTGLLAKMASGVAVVSPSGKIVEANRLLATMMGPRVEVAYEANPGLTGMMAEDIIPFNNIIEPVIDGERESVVRDIQIRERMLTVSVFPVPRSSMVLVICRNMLFSQVRNEEIVARTQKVIRENLDTVQKIAYLLGENASRTEAILNTILDSHTAEDEQ